MRQARRSDRRTCRRDLSETLKPSSRSWRFIVPPAQSEAIAADLAAHGIRHAYLSFKGESHGFRRAETVIACLEAELSFYGQILGFSPPGIPAVAVVTGRTR